MISELFGSKTTEKVLLYLTAMGEGYCAEISKTYNISNSQTQRTLEKLENADILQGMNVGRARVYRLNERWYLAKKLKALLEEELLYMPLCEQKIYFSKRKKPRKKISQNEKEFNPPRVCCRSC